jgi:hypothetical protein
VIKYGVICRWFGSQGTIHVSPLLLFDCMLIIENIQMNLNGKPVIVGTKTIMALKCAIFGKTQPQ